MFQRRLLFACFTAVLLPLFPVICRAKNNHGCNPSSCGSIRNISFPFRIKTDPPNCGHRSYELACENNHTILQLYSGKYFVEEINYARFSMRVIDAGLKKDNCSSLPLYSLTIRNFSDEDSYSQGNRNLAVTFLNCPAPLNSTRYLDSALCNKKGSSHSSLSSLKTYSRVVVGALTASEVENSCTIGMNTLVSPHGQKINNSSFCGIHDSLVNGFELFWFRIYCKKCEARGGYCYLDDSNGVLCLSVCFGPKPPFFHTTSQCFLNLLQNIWNFLMPIASVVIGACLAARILCGIPCISVFFIYKFRRRHLSMDENVEEFLQSHNNLMPIRYSYSEIRKMTQKFKVKLGEGGFGPVYKGKLRSGHLVAVKMLDKSKANGQEFINEVATIGRIHHVNIVQLTGFCVERSKCALVYDFMPKGSLDKYIFSEEEGIILSYQKIYEISLGVALGIEYLHRGCDMQILHFDIKPHNILLDENFTPKVSDFGLAKLYPKNDNTVPLTTARGTTGYMAPELFYRNIGGVSYKADVYSFGMLLMEMVGRKKNLNPFAEHLSQIYDQFNEGKNIEMGDATEEERKMVEKMIIVALWCIQMKPSDRPSMKEVIEMLEGKVEVLQMPPKPFLNPQEMPSGNHEININIMELPIPLDDHVDSISSLDVNEN